MHAAVTLTITSLDTRVARRIEPYAPTPLERLHALSVLHEHGIPCGVRLDPIIPGINDNEIEAIVSAVRPYATHIVASTVKPRADTMVRFATFTEMNSLKWKRRGASYYLPKNQRFALLNRVERACSAYDLTFATCREAYPYHAPSCDGSHLIP